MSKSVLRQPLAYCNYYAIRRLYLLHYRTSYQVPFLPPPLDLYVPALPPVAFSVTSLPEHNRLTPLVCWQSELRWTVKDIVKSCYSTQLVTGS
ncbi:MAG: hypothetical protein IPG48_05115 [Saprospiraceae bacterium]|nr:hypothetical protein [Saprospiraceae bacterium]